MINLSVLGNNYFRSRISEKKLLLTLTLFKYLAKFYTINRTNYQFQNQLKNIIHETKCED